MQLNGEFSQMGGSNGTSLLRWQTLTFDSLELILN